ncbi:MAG: hypothetical protein ACRDCF_01340 [Mycoplasmoidaceae bacterium]
MDYLYSYLFSGSSEENTKNLLDNFFAHRFVEGFLRDEDLNVPLFPTTVQQANHAVDLQYDLDGIVVQLRNLAALKQRLHYLFVGKISGPNLQHHWPILKKHLQLEKYNSAGISALTKTFGSVLAFVDSGHFLNVSVVSGDHTNPHPVFLSENAARANAVSAINTVFDAFAEKVKNLPPEQKQRPSLMKSNANNLGRMNVLKQDQRFVLQVFAEALAEVNTDPSQAIVLSLTKFGQKDPDPIDIASLVDITGVESVSVHAACTLRPKDYRMDMLWSRHGLQQVVGHRGSLYATYGIPEAANFQSNVDQYPMTIERQLKLVFSGAKPVSDITFVQLYAATPHTHMVFTPKHPVSRIVATCGLNNPNHTRTLLKQAKDYVEHMEDLTRKTRCRTHARMEAVFLLTERIPERLVARDFYSETDIFHLLEDFPMVLVFKDNPQSLGLRHVVHPVADHLTRTLVALLSECKEQGGYANSWTAFQLELALEELFYGKPYHRPSKAFSVSLGTSATDPNSLTKQRGFLGLSPVGSASVGESPPPLDTWFKDPIQQTRVLRIFPLTDALQADPSVIGESLVQVLLKDLHERNDRIPTHALKEATPPMFGKLVGCRTVTDFSRDLAERNAFKYPHTFGRAIQLVRAAGHDVQRCLELGLSQLKLFPSIVFWDENRNVKAKWNKKDYVELYGQNDPASNEAQAAALMGDVCSNLEKKQLTYSKTLLRYREGGMPWMNLCLRRLPENLEKDRKVTALTFLSAIALIQNGDFVSFSSLGTLLSELPVTQKRLQQAQLLSHLTLLNSPRVHRLHDSVPYKVAHLLLQAKKRPPPPPPPPRPQPSPEHVEPAQEEDQLIERVSTSTVPANVTGRWTDAELTLVQADPHLTHQEAYKTYLASCRETGLQTRTFQAFKKKRQRQR